MFTFSISILVLELLHSVDHQEILIIREPQRQHHSLQMLESI